MVARIGTVAFEGIRVAASAQAASAAIATGSSMPRPPDSSGGGDGRMAGSGDVRSTLVSQLMDGASVAAR